MLSLYYPLLFRQYVWLCDPMDYSPLGSSVHGISQARMPFPSPGNLLDPGIKLMSPALAWGFLTAEPLGSKKQTTKQNTKYLNIYLCSYLLQGPLGNIFWKSKFWAHWPNSPAPHSIPSLFPFSTSYSPLCIGCWSPSKDFEVRHCILSWTYLYQFNIYNFLCLYCKLQITAI